MRGKGKQTIVWLLMGMLVLGLGGFGVTNFSGGTADVGAVGDVVAGDLQHLVLVGQQVRTGPHVRGGQRRDACPVLAAEQHRVATPAVVRGTDQRVRVRQRGDPADRRARDTGHVDRSRIGTAAANVDAGLIREQVRQGSSGLGADAGDEHVGHVRLLRLGAHDLTGPSDLLDCIKHLHRTTSPSSNQVTC